MIVAKNFFKADLAGSESVGINFDADGILLAAKDHDLGDAVEHGEATADQVLGVFIEGGESHRF